MAASLGMSDRVLVELKSIPVPEAQRRLASMKEELPAKFRAAAFELHPDRNPDDPRAGEKFKALVQVREYLEGLSVVPARPAVNGFPGVDMSAFTRAMRDMESAIRKAASANAKAYAQREKEWVENARKKRREAREAAESKIHKPTKEEVRSYGEPEDEPKTDDSKKAEFDDRGRAVRGFGVGVSFRAPWFPFITDA